MIVLSLGSNLGNRLENLHVAVKALKGIVSSINTSLIYETEALLPDGVPRSWDMPYYNMIITCETQLSPHELLTALKQIERDLGREASKQWAPRIIDIDIIFYDHLVIKTPDLTIPHKETLNRPFVMVPLYQLIPEYRHPILNRSIEEIVGNFKAYVGTFRKTLIFAPKLMGILNITENSFSDGGKFWHVDKAINQALKLIDDGAYVLDLGAQSTNVTLNHTQGASLEKVAITWQEELERLTPVLDVLISELALNGRQIKLSIDSFYPEVFKRLLEKYQLHYINDVSGARNEKLIDIAANTGLKYVLMHSIEVPTRINKLISFGQDPVTQLKTWALEKIKMLKAKGIRRENIIFDPGIGFDKSPSQCLYIMRNLAKFKELEVQILLGHSRKFFMNSFLITPPVNRDLESAVISATCADNVDYLRVHSVAETNRAIIAKSL